MKMFLLFVFFKQSVAWMMLCLLYVLALWRRLILGLPSFSIIIFRKCYLPRQED
jgi:hypothetical protein